MVSDIVQLALSCVILTSLSILLVVNWHLRIATRGQRPLSFRYQISENIRVLRLLTPVVLLDTGVTTTDMVGNMFFQVSPEFEAEKYKSDHGYLQAYIVLRVAAIVFEYCIPVVIVTSKTLRKDIYRVLSKVVGASTSVKNEVEDAWVAREGPQAVYFNYLRDQWAK
ncbi:hypothetical protein OSTOST_15366 [Ostertagia ostertagi]